MSFVEAKRRKNESFESFFRRFSQRVHRSGNMLDARKIRFHEAEAGETQVKRGALRRLGLKEKFEYLTKIGRAPEQKRGRRSRR